ncbi:MAG TPA: LacI family DNA-binding transcriptional regulator [Thermoleophilaceae bacterium]|nr:LacI family DNA-binding transcriptional regulator [Thermoleophilaceae bacterium]
MTTRRSSGSLADVGRRAGVSIATASRVLNGSSHPVSEATRERVLEAARELGYSPSALARALVTRRSRIIGVMVGDIVDAYFAEITRGVEDVAGRAGYMTIICNADRRTEMEIDQLAVLCDYQAEGVIFAGSGYRDDPRGADLAAAVERARERGISVLALALRDFDCPRIVSDNRSAAYDITHYVLSLGHRRVAYISGPPGLYATRDRLAGFRGAAADSDVDAVLVYEGDFTYEQGYAAALQMIAEAELPDAIIGANDETAIGALAALRQARIEVPGRVSVAGMTDTRLARFSDMTTVSVPVYQFGAAAARRIITGESSPTETVLPHRVVPRSTTARRR